MVMLQFLFQFASFKAQSEGLPADDRKAFAEKIALAFYSSLAGDSESDSETVPEKWSFLLQDLFRL